MHKLSRESVRFVCNLKARDRFPLLIVQLRKTHFEKFWRGFRFAQLTLHPMLNETIKERFVVFYVVRQTLPAYQKLMADYTLSDCRMHLAFGALWWNGSLPLHWPERDLFNYDHMFCAFAVRFSIQQKLYRLCIFRKLEKAFYLFYNWSDTFTASAVVRTNNNNNKKPLHFPYTCCTKKVSEIFLPRWIETIYQTA